MEGVEVLNDTFFNEISVKLSKNANDVVEVLAGEGILAGVPASRLYPDRGLDDVLILAVTETVTDEDIDALITGLKEALS